MIEPTHRENDQGMITAELLKLLGVIAGLGLSPLLSSRLGWYWAIGMAAGGMMLLAGALFSLRIDRKIRRKRLEQLRERLLQETALAEVSVQVHAEPKVSQELLFSNPRLAALRASLQAGWISERQFSAQAGQILNEMALTQTEEAENFALPNSVIALGVFILLPAVITLMVIANRIQHPAEIAAYFSSPALLLWMAIEGMRLSGMYQERPWNTLQWLAGLSGLLYILSAIAFWFYMGFFFGEALLVWLFALGAGLAVVGAALALGMVAWQRRGKRPRAAGAEQRTTKQDQESASQPAASGDQEDSTREQRLPEHPLSGLPGAPGAESPMVGGEQPAQAAQPGETPASRARFETFQGKDGKTYFRLRAGNGEIILSSQGYTTLQACRKGIRSVQANAGLPERYQVRTTRSGEPYFVLLAGNRQVIGRSESYSSEAACERGIIAVITNIKDAGIRDLVSEDEPRNQSNNPAILEG